MEDIKSEKEKIQRIRNIIEREIEKELINKQNEVTDISDKIKSVLRNLDILKYVVAVNYYDQNTALTTRKGQDDENEEEKTQTQIHPCIKKLLPFHSNYDKSFGDMLSSHSYETRNSKKSNSSESSSSDIKKEINFNENTSQVKCNGSNNTKMPKYIPPLPNTDETVGTVNSTRGSVSKDHYRIVVGNISKWIPPDTREDNSTHKWMVYIRNKDSDKDITKLLKKVRYFLHESYKPHDIIDVTSAPFHLTRRGWGEFPIRVQLHFTHPLNKPVDIIHNLKLDMTCSGIQMLGSESVVDVVLHQSNSFVNGNDGSKTESNVKHPAMEEEKVKEKQDIFDGSLLTNINGMRSNFSVDIEKECDVIIKEEPEEHFENEKLLNSKIEEVNLALNNSRKFLLDRRKIMRIIEIEHNYLKSDDSESDKSNNKLTNSIFNVEVNKNYSKEKLCKNGAVLDSIPINQIINKKSQDRLNKMEIGFNKSEEEVFKKLKLVANKIESETQSKYCMKVFRHMYLVNVLQRAHATKQKTVESLVKWFVQRWPIITKLSLDPTYKNVHPYSCPTEEEFLKYNIGKQRSAEWFRAKAIQKVLKSLKPIIPIEEEIWSTKQILLWSRFHGYCPAYFQPGPKPEPLESSKKIKPNYSSSDSEDENSDNPNKRLKMNDVFLNGLNMTEKKRNYKKSRRKECAEKILDRHKNYKDCNTYTEENDGTRFGSNDFRVLQQANLTSDIEVVEVDKEIVKESPTKKKEAQLTITATPSSETILKNFVCETSKQIGIKLVEEEIIPGVKCDSVSRVMSQCVSSFLDELVRRSLAQAWTRNGDRCPEALEVNDVLATLIEHPQFDLFTNRGLGIPTPVKSET